MFIVSFFEKYLDFLVIDVAVVQQSFFWHPKQSCYTLARDSVTFWVSIRWICGIHKHNTCNVPGLWDWPSSQTLAKKNIAQLWKSRTERRAAKNAKKSSKIILIDG